MRIRPSLQMILFSVLVSLGLGACDKSEPAPAARLSGVGDSCLKTADCVENAKCVEQKCVDPHAPSVVPPAGEQGASELGSTQPTNMAALGEVLKAAEQAEAQAAGANSAPGVVPEPCEHVEHMTGTWSFTSLGILANEPDKGAVNGHYRVFIERAMDCSLNATITKTGFGKTTFTAEKYQVGQMGIEGMGGGAALSDTYGGAVTLLRQDGSARLDMAFNFRFDGDRLTGVWHYRGDSWNAMCIGPA